jgi:AraC-like DNA-binding protein
MRGVESLLMQAKAHIDRHLNDPGLSPSTVAAALHVSLRTLYRAFGEQQQPAGAWIRNRRLERCRRDLTDPALAIVPVHVLATRWGFADASQFSRAFSERTGSPRMPTVMRKSIRSSVRRPERRPSFVGWWRDDDHVAKWRWSTR